MKTSSAKAKGRRLQQQVAADIIEVFGLESDDVTSRPSSSPGEDILLSPAARELFPFSVECKNVERLNVFEAFDQSVENAGKHDPILVMSKNRRENPLVVLDWATFLSLVHDSGLVRCL